MGIRRVVFDVDAHTAAVRVLAGHPEASYELMDHPGDGRVVCRRRGLDGSIRIVLLHPGGEEVLDERRAPEPSRHPRRLVGWRYGELHLEGILIPPGDGDPPWATVTFLHGGPVGALAAGGHEAAGAWADRRWATFVPEFPASGICGEAAMLAAFSASELPEQDHEVDAVLAGVDVLVSAGLADARRLFVVGHSYGAYLVNRALTHTDRFRAAVCWEGVADVRRLDAHSLAHQAEWRGGTPTETPERWSAASPIDRVQQVRTPTLLFYGGRSRLVRQGKRWYDALRRSGVDAELAVEPYVGHTFEDDDSADAFHHRVAEWFAGHCDA